MPYTLKEIVYTIQGEGARAGAPAVFARFAGCNLWSGLEEDRADAPCNFCDTDFVGTDGPRGGKYATADDLADAINQEWPTDKAEQGGPMKKFVVCTGGEPLLQLNSPLVEALHERNFDVAVETNGTLPVPDGVDWVCVSPKAGVECVVREGDELKLIYPQQHAEPELYIDWRFEHFFLQPMDGPQLRENMSAVLDYCKLHPRWRVSLQLHKVLGTA